MNDSDNTIDEQASYFSSQPADELLRFARSECRQPLIDAKEFCQIIMNSEG